MKLVTIYYVAISGISNHLFGKQYEFEKTHHER